MGPSNSKTFDCPLCFKPFTKPRVLPCLHSFCEKCLGAHIEMEVQGDTKFMCPLCAAPTVPFDSKLAVDKWASDFPLNTLICTLLKSPGLQQKGNICEPCETDGETATAKFWCMDCGEKMCDSCKKLHKRNKQMKHHTIISIDEMSQQPNVHFDQECCLHRVKILFYCMSHKLMCCAVCIATDHRQCNEVQSINDIVCAQSQRFKSNYPIIIKNIRSIKTEMEKTMSEKTNNANQVLVEKEQIVHDLDVRIDRIIERLNKARNIFRNETEQLYKDTESSLQEKKKKVESFVTNIQNSSNILEVIKEDSTTQQQFITVETIHHQLSSHYCQLKRHLKADTEIHFAINQSKVLDDLEGTLDSLANVKVSKQSSTTTRDVLLHADRMLNTLDSLAKVSTEMCAAQVEKQDSMTSPVTFVKAVTRQKLGNGTFFTGGTYIADGRLVMADYGANKNRLVELDAEYNMVKEYKITGRPTDVAAGNKDNEIYIAANKNYVYKCTLHTDLTIVSQIKAPSGTWGIAVSGDNIIIGTSDAVLLLTQNGSTVKSIPKSGDYYSDVAVSQTQRTIYHKDNNDVVCRTWGGQEVFRYQDQQLRCPRGIGIDSDRNVYICGCFSSNLHLISSDGQRSRVTQLHKITWPYGVVVHPQKKELVVTSNSEDTVFEVYKYR